MRKTQPNETGDARPRTVGFGQQRARPRDAEPPDRSDGPQDVGAPDRGSQPAGFSPLQAGPPGRETPVAKRGTSGPELSGPDLSGADPSGSDLSGPDLSEADLSGADLSAPWDDEIGSFGTWLRRQREGRGIDLQEIAEESKISLVNLRAFEEDRFEVLPAPVFAKGFLRQYARYVGLDPEEVVNFYVAACRNAEGEEEPVEPPPETRNGSSWKLGGVALLLTALFALTIWVLTRWNEVPPASPAPQVVAEPPTGRGPEESTAAEREPGIDAGIAPDAEPQESGTPSAGSPEVGTPEVGILAPLRVTLDFSGECWVEARVDGERQVAENKIQGESLLLEAAERVEITVGNFDAVRVEVNGHPFAFDEVPGTKVRTQRIDLETVAGLVAPEDGEG